MNKPQNLAYGSIIVGLIVLALKYWAAHITGSVALMSDALESIVNVVTAFAALIAVNLAARPANDALPFGYYKAEYFSAVLEGVFILVAALLIFYQAWQGFMNPMPIDAPFEGIAINVFASIINGVWCYVLISSARKMKSPALEADGKHLLTDVISSVGVVIALLLVVITGWEPLDYIIAVLVGLNILWSGSKLVTSSIGGLMDAAMPHDQLNEIRTIIKDNAEGAIEAHDIRTRQAGKMSFVDFHLVVRGDMTVDDAHTICDRIEAQLVKSFTDIYVTIHVEPEKKAKHSGIVVI